MALDNLIIQHCQPFEEITRDFRTKLNAHGITLQRIYKDGRRVYFTNSEHWCENFLSKNYFIAAGYDKYAAMPARTLWAHWPKEDKIFYHLMKDAKDHFNYANGLVWIDSFDDYLDAYTIRGFANDDHINNRYMQLYKEIEKFFYWLSIATKDIADQQLKNSIFIPEEKVLDYYTTPKGIVNDDQDCLGTFLKMEAVAKSLNLTCREFEILLLLLKNKKIKQISYELNISSRRVSECISHIKQKTSCYTLYKLLNTYGWLLASDFR